VGQGIQLSCVCIILQIHACIGLFIELSLNKISFPVLQMGPYLEKTVASFRLLPPTGDYVPPYKDPWRFWWQSFILFIYNISLLFLVNSISVKFQGKFSHLYYSFVAWFCWIHNHKLGFVISVGLMSPN
jgi:hypothetical protein